MERSGNNETYNSFDEYGFNKDIYDKIKNNITDTVDSFPNDITIENTDKGYLIIMDCFRLKKYIENFSSKEICQKKNCFQYINYLLNHTVRMYYNSKESIFNVYINYLNHPRNKTIRNICFSELYYMAEDQYQKINKLYAAYNSFKIFNSKKYSTPPCSSAKICAITYNNIITTYKKLDDIKFCKALNDFETVFQQNEHISSGKCNTEIPYLLSYRDACVQEEEKPLPVLEASGQQDRNIETQNHQETLGITDDHTPLSESLSGTLPITLFSSGISALLILLTFYKFTPLGKFLKFQIQRFKGVTRTSDDELYEMQQNTSEYHDRNIEYNEYNISYNSL
ncbi:PIR Superfamily Protein [Plasmodium ovale wallikeri]|uniref:PIR Superfamily Protein n=1 Tax=Plasmodium ovale wallikeri TaxID=864142 RepID=A0A1A9AJM6_PLAOA|nr:PIR Superfamily Protein [Plasmodium ovale wallikeri]SBT56822.1 PIR Superfamily Protein [Plasmodium ovale wallikeri]